MDNKYEIQLGVKLDTSDLKQQINQINNGKHKIDLGVNLKVNDIRDRIKAYNNNANNIKVKLGVKLDTSDIKQQIKNLNLSGLSKANGMNVAVNTESLEKSLNEVKDIISDIRTSLGSLSGDGMKDVVTSINQMATALGKAENETDSLVKSLNELNKKDFNINVGLDLGKKDKNNMLAYGRTARKQIIPELESQIKELENMLGGTGKAFGKASRHLDLYEYGANMGSDKIVQRMEAMEDYIVAMKKVASAEGINLDGFDKIHRNATELINDVTGVESAVNKAGDIPEKLKNIFGGSVDGENLSKQLESVVTDLKEIKATMQTLSSGASLDGLIQSFNRLSDVLDKLDANFNRIKNNLGSGFVNNGAVQTVQQVGQNIGKSVTQSLEQSLNLDDVIDQEVLKLMDKFSIVGEKGDESFDKIKQAVIECRRELGILNSTNLDVFGDNKDLLMAHGTSGAVDKVTKAIADQMRVANDLGDEYVELANYMTNFNDPAKGNKVRLPDFIKQEQGDDYRSNRSSLGIAFNTERGISFVDFVNDLNHELGDTINLTNGEATAMDELLRKVELGRKQRDALQKSENYRASTASTEEILEQNGIDRNEIYSDVMSIVNVVDTAEQQIAQASTQSTNVVVQNEERKQQAYQETERVYDKLSKDISLTRNAENGVDFKNTFDSSNQAAQEAKRHFQELLADEKAAVSVAEQFDDNNMLKSFTVNVKRASGEVESLRYALQKIDDENYGDFIYMGASSNDKNVQKQYEARIKKANDLQIELDKIKSEYTDKGSTKPIKNLDYINALDGQYEKVEKAILDVKNADDSTFESMVSNAKREKVALESMIKVYRNADNVSNSLKGTDFTSGVKIRIEELGKLKAQASDYPQMARTIEELDRAIEGIGDKSSLDSFTDQLKVARAELAKVKAETIATNRKEKVGINVSGVTSQIANIQRISPEINEFKTVIDGAEVSVESLLNDLSRVNTAGDFSVVKARFKAFEDAAESAGIAITEVVTKASTIDKIKFKISDTGFNGFTQEVARAHADVEKLDGTYDDLTDSLKELDIAMEKVYSADAIDDNQALANANKEYEDSLKRVTSQLKLYQQEEDRAFKNEMLDQKRTALNSDMEIWLKENTRATRDFGEEIRKLQSSLNGLDDKGLRLAGKQFTNIKKQAQAMGKTGLTVFDQLKAKAAQYASYLSAAEIFMYAEQAFRSMFEQVKLIDSAMTELKKVTDETNASYDKFLTNAATRAREIGTTIDGLVSSTADFARLGYNFVDSQGLAEVANIYAVVGDEIEGVEGATESLISTMAAFKDSATGMSNTDFAMSIIDKFNEIGKLIA